MKKFYCLVMFPYPSGSGIHVGHWYNYAIMDSYARWKRFKGVDVFQPFGYDAFGLPAENYAKQTGIPASIVTQQSIMNIRTEMERMNTMYEERLVTCRPYYVKWTQWVFKKLVEHGMAYKAFADVNYCPSCETVVANEQVIDERCERCSTKVETRNLNQWFIKITDYKQRLIDNLDKIDYPKKTIKQQRHWLENQKDWCISRQRSWGCPIPIEGETDTMDTFMDSSFYYLRYLMPNDSEEFISEEAKQMMPVDLYVGGNEHACMHLIYARFINMFLYDIGYSPVEEPFKKVIHQGMITYNGAKMSKSKGNSVNASAYEPDVMRLYLMFIGHYFDGGDWNDNNIKGIIRFINRMKTWLSETGDDEISTDEMLKFYTVIDGYTESFKFNKVVSEFMVFYNKHKDKKVTEQVRTAIVNVFNNFAPDFNI